MNLSFVNLSPQIEKSINQSIKINPKSKNQNSCLGVISNTESDIFATSFPELPGPWLVLLKEAVSLLNKEKKTNSYGI